MSTAKAEEEIDLAAVHDDLMGDEVKIARAKAKHNAFLRELGLPELPLRRRPLRAGQPGTTSDT